MTQQYTNADLLKAFRAENPDAANIPDDKILAAIEAEDPELVRGATAYPDRGPAAAVNRVVGGMLEPFYIPGYNTTDPNRGLPGIVKGLWSNLTESPVKRGMAAMEAARGPEHQGTGLDPFLHGVVSSVPILGNWVNDMMMRSKVDPSGALTEAAASGIPVTGPVGAKKYLQSTVRHHLRKAERDVGRGMAPAPGKQQITAARIAPDVVASGETGMIQQAANDLHVLEKTNEAGAMVEAAAREVPANTTLPMSYFDDAIEGLKKKLDAYPPSPQKTTAQQTIQTIQDDLHRRFGENANWHSAYNYRDKLDEGIYLKGGFEPGQAVDPVPILAAKEVAAAFRDALGRGAAKATGNTKFVDANRNFSLWKPQEEFVMARRPELRGLPTFEKKLEHAGHGPWWPKGNLPVVGSLWDDLAAIGVGTRIAGTPGGVLTEAANLTYRNPTVSRVRAAMNRKLAELGGYRPPVPEPPGYIQLGEPTTLSILGGRVNMEGGASFPPPPAAPVGVRPQLTPPLPSLHRTEPYMMPPATDFGAAMRNPNFGAYLRSLPESQNRLPVRHAPEMPDLTPAVQPPQTGPWIYPRHPEVRQQMLGEWGRYEGPPPTTLTGEQTPLLPQPYITLPTTRMPRQGNLFSIYPTTADRLKVIREYLERNRPQ